MRINAIRSAGAVAALAVVAMGPGTARAAVAAPTTVDVPCSTSTLTLDMQAATGGETLNLAANCLYQLTSALPSVGRALTIKGNGATLERSTAPGTPSFAILTVTTGGSLKVGALSFRNGGSGLGGAVSDVPLGGAILNEGNSVYVNGGTFYGNTAEIGGAIENDLGGALTVRGAAFSHNSAAFGGAIDNESTASVTNSIFTGNTALEWGGAVLTAANGTVTNCIFVHNTAFLGGGLFTTFNATVNGSAFQFNQAEFNGGAIFDDGTLSLSHGRFGGNAASGSGGGLYGDIFGQSTITGSTFSRNQANLGGGIENENVANLTNTRMVGNTAGQFGGGIYTDWVLAATKSQITQNSAGGDGGGIYNTDSFGPPGTVSLGDTMVFGNHPDDCVGCTAAGPGRLFAPARAASARQAPLALPGAAAPAGIKRLAQTVTRGHDTLVIGANPGR
jgi:hypothetical protein